MTHNLDELPRQMMEKDAEGEFERVMGVPSRDWVAMYVSERKMSAARAKERRLLHQVSNAYHRRIANGLLLWPMVMGDARFIHHAP
jgi:hypothetical protein